MPTEPRRPRRTPRAHRTRRVASVVAALAVAAWVLWPRGTSESAAPAAPSQPSTPTASLVAPTPTPDAAPTPSPTAAAPATPVDPSDASAYAARVRAAADDARAAQGLPRFADAACATPLALDRATALLGKPLAHAPLNALWAACPGSTVVGENLIRGGTDPAGAVAAWMASPGHRANLLNPGFTGMVVQCAHDGAQMVCSQLFVGGGS